MRRISCWLALFLLASAAWAGGNVPGPGEIAVYGRVLSVDTARGTFTMEVSRFRTPRGEDCLNPSRPRSSRWDQRRC
jgi:hypothetical protein